MTLSMVKTQFLNLKGSKIFELRLRQFSNIKVFRKRFFSQSEITIPQHEAVASLTLKTRDLAIGPLQGMVYLLPHPHACFQVNGGQQSGTRM
jgi:hypothetical protein